MERFTVEVVSSGEHFPCSREENLLQGMEKSRVGLQMLHSIPVGCRGGGCGVCRVRVLSGDYETSKMSARHVTEDQKRAGFVLACRAFPRSAIKLELETPGVDVSNES